MPRPERTQLERRKRAAARAALYGTLALTTAAALTLSTQLSRSLRWQVQETWHRVDYRQLEEVQLLQRYLQIDTTSDRGDEVAGAEFLASVLADAGVRSHLERVGDRHANLWAVLDGEEPGALVLHNHIDTDPVDPAEPWVYPPFAGTIKLPWIYGRGVFDMKGVAIAQLVAFLRAHEHDGRRRRSLVFLATGSEEVGSDYGTLWVLRNHPQLARRFWGVLTEGGVVEALTQREVKYWGIEVIQKRFAHVEACSPSRERLELLRADVRSRGRIFADLELPPATEAFLAAYAPTRTAASHRRLLGQPRLLLNHPASWRPVPTYVKALLRDEAMASRVHELADGSFSVDVIFNLLPESDFAAVRERLLPGWMTQGLALAPSEPVGSGRGSPLDHPLYRAAAAAVVERYPRAVTGPFFLPWRATDARFFRAAGIPAYGFSPFLILSTDTLQVSKPNERMALPGFVGGVELYTDLVRRLVTD